MGNTAIRVEGLGKQYTIGGAIDKTKTFRESLVDTVTAPYRRLRKVLSGRAATSARTDETFWALQGIDFTVEQGEVVGIIGHNGAGKSTLLKILSRITDPTVGSVTLYGRVGALLEVGTGFHPELTGRENVYMNAAILGMSRKEINRKFDEIVDFAEVEQFIETPVKHYSSGMTLRLGFAVAAHLEPEILIVDEVLAVGDAAFQRKCLGKMNDVASEGRTVLFVSHNMAAIANLTARTIVLKKGGVAFDGETARGIEEYMNASTVTQKEGVIVIGKTLDNGITVEALHIRDDQGNLINAVPVLCEVHLAVTLDVREDTNVSVSFVLMNSVGVRVVSYNNYHVMGEDLRVMAGKAMIGCTIESLPLVPDRYFIDISIRSANRIIHKFSNVAALDVLPADVYGTSFIPSTRQGVIVAMNGRWQVEQPTPQLET